jgi:(R)-2-hydroxyacyl-CoA dehydratese activating ATPase
MTHFAGIDVGSRTTNAVILDEKGEITAYGITETRANSTVAAEAALEKALARGGLERKSLRRIVSTGYGRVSVPFADKAVTEISCHALGACTLFPDTGMVIDIGGQDSKVIKVEPGGKVVDFSMNDKCAAGTGRFLEVMASKLQVPLQQMGELSLRAAGEVRISSVCTVFAESEVISLVARNHPKEEILRGLHRAIVNRVWGMVTTVGIRLEVTMSGGVAKNKGVLALMEEKLGRPLRVSGEPQIIGALGAALHARSLDASRQG